MLRHLPLVHLVARQLAGRLPANCDISDLISAGMFGLMDAVRRFDPEAGASLATYARIRIRGSILDSMRSLDWAPRRLRSLARRIEQARQSLTTSLGRVPTASELASHLGLTLQCYEEQLRDIRSLEMAGFADTADEDVQGTRVDDIPHPAPNALEALLGTELKGRLTTALEALPPRERQVIALYYVEELTMRDVGTVMGVSESRVCQLHSLALARLKKRMTLPEKSQPSCC